MVANIRSGAKQIKKFYSKRNQVYLCSDENSQFISKKFIDISHYHTEQRVYKKIQGLGLAPELIDCDEEVHKIELSYIDGTTVIEALEDYELEGDISKSLVLLRKVLDWLMTFYEIVYTDEGQMVYHDINLRNFIVHEDRIIGIDFECCDYGDLRYELVKVMAMYLQYDPIESDYKKKVVHSLFESFYQEQAYLPQEFARWIEEETQKILLRRHKKHN